VLLAVEHAPKDRRAWYGSFPQYGTPVGLAGSSLAILAARAASGDEFLVWGWRLPFLFSAVLVLLGLWVRVRVGDAEEFTRARRSGALVRYPIGVVTRRHWRVIGAGVAVTLVCHAAYIVTAFLPAYATTTLHVSSDWALAALIVASVTSAVVLAVVGSRADRVDRRRYAATVGVLSALWAFPAFALTAAFGGAGLVVAAAGALAVGSLQYAVLPSLLADQFPVHLRYTGVSACFQISAVLGGALLPIVTSWLVGRSGGDYWPAAALMAAAGGITALGASRCRERSAAPRGVLGNPGTHVRTTDSAASADACA
jgi:MHS family shikimate/dehydroshikimate transporter-like MFS transporter